MNQAIQVFRDNGIARDRLEAERAAEQRIKDAILQMMHRLQVCQSLCELSDVVARFAPRTFPQLAGRLYIYEERGNGLELAASWLEPLYSAASFAPNACWGFRRGHAHASNGARGDICCPHINDEAAASLCVPLTAQGEAVGLLYFEHRPGAEASEPENTRLYLELVSENVALALANLRLRERLANLASQDALTGLFNRRALDVALSHWRDDEPFACIMIDIDHFKRFNDAFGHDAGDAVMQHVAMIVRQVVGDAGQAFRFGGEEFTVLAANTKSAQAYALAETLRQEIAAAPLAHHGRMLGRISISLGVAAAPEDGPSATILKRADAALLQAKSAGRNRTITAGDLTGANAARAG
jgi:diguanylate cyclase (GGDEF)-like protein